MQTYRLFVVTNSRPPAFAPSLEAAFKKLGDGISIEDNPILVSYGSVAGGSVKKEKTNHMRNHTEAVLLIHKAGKPFTCNTRVVPDDIHGVGQGPIPKAKQTLTLTTLPNGAPDGGARVVFPPPVCALLVAR